LLLLVLGFFILPLLVGFGGCFDLVEARGLGLVLLVLLRRRNTGSRWIEVAPLLNRRVIGCIGPVRIGARLLFLRDGLIGGLARGLPRVDSLIQRAIAGDAS